MTLPRLALAAFVLFIATLVTANWPAERLPAGTVADLVRVEKSARRLSLLRNGVVLKQYRVSLGRAPVGAKEREGDAKTPEGRYRLDWRKPDSSCHRALHVSHPEPPDVACAAAQGVPPGDAIMVHGLRNGLGWLGRLHRLADWTRGCIAVTDPEIEETWRVVPDGTPIEIVP